MPKFLASQARQANLQEINKANMEGPRVGQGPASGNLLAESRTHEKPVFGETM